MKCEMWTKKIVLDQPEYDLLGLPVDRKVVCLKSRSLDWDMLRYGFLWRWQHFFPMRVHRFMWLTVHYTILRNLIKGKHCEPFKHTYIIGCLTSLPWVVLWYKIVQNNQMFMSVFPTLMVLQHWRIQMGCTGVSFPDIFTWPLHFMSWYHVQRPFFKNLVRLCFWDVSDSLALSYHLVIMMSRGMVLYVWENKTAMEAG